MTDYYPIVEVLREWAPESEEMGSKEKFWYSPEAGNESRWLFKHPRQGRGEHWAEKVAAEVAGLLEIRCARVELAVFQGQQGSATEGFTSENRTLMHGNEVLSRALPDYEATERNFHLSDHTLENIWLALDRTFDDADDVKRQLAGYLVLDAVVGNGDRHSENWGTLQVEYADSFAEYLAPSYDHGSSLGRELMDERRERFLTDRRVGAYAERGRGGVHWNNVDRHGPSPLELIRLAAPRYPDLFRPAIAKLNGLDDSSFRQILDRMPEDWMTPTARAFALELMRYSREQLREVV